MSVAKFVRTESGSSLVEFAIVAPMLLLLLLGLIEVGRYANLSITVSNAARAGVQYGAQSLVTAADTTGMQSAALADAQNASGLTASASDAYACANGATWDPVLGCPGSRTVVNVQVTVTGTFSPLFSFPGLPAFVPISAQATMQVAQ